MTRLSQSELCPIHRRRDCCGRKPTEVPQGVSRKWVKVSPGVYRIEDPHHPRGFRERRSASAMKKLLIMKLHEQRNICGICKLPIADFRDADPDHKEPRGMGAARRDDHPDNIQATHKKCNLDKGSKRMPAGEKFDGRFEQSIHDAVDRVVDK